MLLEPREGARGPWPFLHHLAAFPADILASSKMPPAWAQHTAMSTSQEQGERPETVHLHPSTQKAGVGGELVSAWILTLPILCMAHNRSCNFSRHLSFPNCKMGTIAVPSPRGFLCAINKL